jgi:hypothetical protein
MPAACCGSERDVRVLSHLCGVPREHVPPEVPRPQRAEPAAPSLHEWLARCPTREDALYRAYREGGITMTAMARELGLSVARVSQLVSMGQASIRASNSRPDPI